MKEDLRQKITELDVPVYFFSGRYDYTVNYKMSEEYLASLKAPLKGLYLFENSAHSPMFEEPTRLGQILKKDVLSCANTLANIR